jgi:hypothetical protein
MLEGVRASPVACPSAPAVAKLAGAVLLAVVAATSGAEPERLLLVGAAALALAAWGLRGVLAPVRLAAEGNHTSLHAHQAL